MEVGGQLHTPAASPSGTKPQYRLERKLGGLQSQIGYGSEKKKIPSLPLPAIEPKLSIL
jgi:hypothetical protein